MIQSEVINFDIVDVVIFLCRQNGIIILITHIKTKEIILKKSATVLLIAGTCSI